MMAVYEFCYVIGRGKMDETECTIDVEMSEVEARRLVTAAKKNADMQLTRKRPVCGLYDRVYGCIMKDMIAIERMDLSDVEDYLAEMAEEYDDDEEDWDDESEITDKQIIRYLEDTLTIRIYLPEALRS